MTKKEIIWREILFQARKNKKNRFTQKELSQKFGFSLSTIFNALKVPRQANIIEVRGRFFLLRDYKRLLYLWASARSFKKDLIYQTYVKEVNRFEGDMPPEISFGFYSAFKFLYKTIPVDYDHVYVYLNPQDIKNISQRLRLNKNSKIAKNVYPNFFILAKDKWQDTYGKTLLPEQIFVDIWNASEWYAKDFLKKLEEELL